MESLAWEVWEWVKIGIVAYITVALFCFFVGALVMWKRFK
jgi:hypothetical protein